MLKVIIVILVIIIVLSIPLRLVLRRPKHKHKCGKCAFVWEHGNEAFDNREAHTCSRCGAVQWEKYFGQCAVTKI